jgi:hypothetical protein
MGLGETLVADDLSRRGRARHLADAVACFVPGDLGRRTGPAECSNCRRAVHTA